jgi:hypothetical protein
MSEPVEVEVIEAAAAEPDETSTTGGALVARPPEHHPATTLFGTDDPVAVVEKAQRVAEALADVINKRGLFKQIGTKKHVLVEGWTLLGSMLGVYPVTEWTRPMKDSKGKDGWEARVVAQTRDGAVVGTREAMCSRTERRWKDADDYAIRSMAQTRAVSGALASPLRFIMELAGYAGTPESEMHSAGVEARVEHVAPANAPRNFAEIFERLLALGHPAEDWADWWIPQAIDHLFQKRSTKELNQEQRSILGQRLGTVVLALEDAMTGVDFPPPDRATIQAAFAGVTDGVELDGPPWRLSPEETDRPTMDEMTKPPEPEEGQGDIPPFGEGY